MPVHAASLRATMTFKLSQESSGRSTTAPRAHCLLCMLTKA